MTRLTDTASPSTQRTHKKVLSRDSFVNDVATQDTLCARGDLNCPGHTLMDMHHGASSLDIPLV